MTFLGIDRTLHPSLDEINFLQAGTGAVQRDAQSKMRDIVSVKDFGAVGDGVTDDTAAIQAAIDAFSATVGTVILPPGDYKLTATVTKSANQNFTLRGSGNGVTRLICTGTHGLQFTPTSQNIRLSLSDFDLVADKAAAGRALDIQYPAPTGLVTPQVRIENIDVYGSSNSNYFDRGVSLLNASICFIENCLINGQGGNPTTIPSAYGIYLEGTFDVNIKNCRLTFWQSAVYVYDYAEGVSLQRVVVEYSDHGFRKEVVGATPVTEALEFHIADSHLTCRKRGILMAEVKAWFISNVHIQTRDDAASPITAGSAFGLTDFVGIEVQGVAISPETETDLAVIENVIFYASTANNSKAVITGLVAADTKNLVIRDSTFGNCGLGMWLQSDTEDTKIEGIKFLSCTTDITDDGTRNDTPANRNPSAELVEGSAISLSTGVAANVTSLTLPAGDWELFANFAFKGNAATTVSFLYGSISTTSATVDVGTGKQTQMPFNAETIFNFASPTNIMTGPARFTFTSPTAVYMVAVASFGVNTCTVYGRLSARRRM